MWSTAAKGPSWTRWSMAFIEDAAGREVGITVGHAPLFGHAHQGAYPTLVGIWRGGPFLPFGSIKAFTS